MQMMYYLSKAFAHMRRKWMMMDENYKWIDTINDETINESKKNDFIIAEVWLQYDTR